MAGGVVAMGLFGMAKAHEHHGEEIPEGEAVSAEPLVCSSMRSPLTFQGCVKDTALRKHL